MNFGSSHLNETHPSRRRIERPDVSRRVRFRAVSLLLAIAVVAGISGPLPAQQGSDDSQEAKPLTVERIFDSKEFTPQPLGKFRWLKGRAAYTILERADKDEDKDKKDDETVKQGDESDDDARDGRGGGRSIVRYDAASGQREVLVQARLLIPTGESSPLTVDDYAWSDDGSQLLIFTAAKRVWRQRTRGDYWVLDLSGRELQKLGGDAPPSTTMFAKFSPDGRQVAYVQQNNIYVENLRDHRITQLTRDGSNNVINGTFDWVYEEELSLRDGFRWSPDGRSIAYWQLDSTGVREIYLLNHTDSVYPQLTTIKYPKVGEQNSASRLGVVSATGGPTRWLTVPGDPRNHYIARIDWAKNSRELVVQQLNRLQNTNRVMLADAVTGEVKTILTEQDDAWLDVYGRLHWLDDGERFLWLSERDGWRHGYTVSRSGEEVQLITPGEFDIIARSGGTAPVGAVDQASGWFYFYASPENPTQRYLYRARLGGSAPLRVTPADQPGTHTYQFSDDARWAIHTYSSFDTPPVTSLVSLPDHRAARVLTDNSKLREKLAQIDRRPADISGT